MSFSFYLIFFLLGPVNASASGGGFIGNGGNGIDYGGALYVWDLFNVGAEKHPYFGGEIDLQLPPLPNSHLNFDYPELLLAAKLTDMNRASPGLGDFALAAMKQYTWILEDFPLTPIPNIEDPVAVPPGAMVVQIANRLGTIIRIHSASWNRLDDKNKVALLIHEAIYSLVKPAPYWDLNGSMYQSARTAQEITGSLFSASYYASDPWATYSKLLGVLAIPLEAPVTLEELRTPPSWKLVVEPNLKFEFHFTNSTSYADLVNFLSNACRQSGKRSVSGFYRNPFYVVSVLQYEATPPSQKQSYIRIQEGSPEITSQKFGIGNFSDCMSNFALELREASAGIGL